MSETTAGEGAPTMEPSVAREADYLLTSLKLDQLLKRFVVAVHAFVAVADLPEPGAPGDDERFDVWRAELERLLRDTAELSDNDSIAAYTAKGLLAARAPVVSSPGQTGGQTNDVADRTIEPSESALRNQTTRKGN